MLSVTSLSTVVSCVILRLEGVNLQAPGLAALGRRGDRCARPKPCARLVVSFVSRISRHSGPMARARHAEPRRVALIPSLLDCKRPVQIHAAELPADPPACQPLRAIFCTFVQFLHIGVGSDSSQCRLRVSRSTPGNRPSVGSNRRPPSVHGVGSVGSVGFSCDVA